MIINRYLIHAIIKPLATVLAVLVTLFASYCAASFLSDAANGLLPVIEVAKLTGLKVLIALEVLIPASLYVSVILSFARLHEDSEFAAMSALRMPPLTLALPALMVAGFLAVTVGGLSMFVRPWAYRQLHELSGRAATLLDVDEMVPGTFYVGQNGTRVIMLVHRDGPGSPARNIFVKLRHPDRTEILSAKLGYSVPPAAGSHRPDVYLHDVDVYELDHTDGSADTILQADGMTLDPNSTPPAAPGYSAVAAPSTTLFKSDSSEDVAELQWRLSTPISTLLLGLLGVPLSRSRPRDGKYARLTTAMLLYFGYYLLSTSVRTWVQHGEIPRFPGIWWVSALLGLALIGSTPELGRRWSLRRLRAWTCYPSTCAEPRSRCSRWWRWRSPACSAFSILSSSWRRSARAAIGSSMRWSTSC